VAARRPTPAAVENKGGYRLKQIEVKIPESPSPPPRRLLLQRVTPLGWATAVIASIFVLSGAALLARMLTGCAAELTDLPTVPPITPTPATATPTSLYPTATPTPDGWTVTEHPLTGEEYLSPPAADEQAIREAFDAVLSCYCIEDGPDQVVLEQFDRDAVLETVDRLALPYIADHCRARLVVTLTHLGPEGHVYCVDHDKCYFSRAKLGYFGSILYDDEPCQGLLGEAAPCVFRPSEGQEADHHPCEMFSGTMIYQEEGGIWTLTDLQITPFNCPD
jgi:hypothetical protein